MRSSALVLLAVLSAARPAPAQSTSPPPQAPAHPTIHANSTLVLVPTLVRTSSGDLVYGLHASDFRVTDNGVAQKITLDPLQQQPLAILVVMQTGGAAPRQFGYYRGLATMLSDLDESPQCRAGVLTFDSKPEDIWDLEPHPQSLQTVLANPDPGDGGAAVLDAVQYGIGLLRKAPPSSRRIMLLISQPDDEGSKARPEEVVRQLGENNITIISVSFSPEKAWLKDQFTEPREGNKPYQLSPNLPKILYTFNLSTPIMEALNAMRADAAAEVATLSGGEHVRFDDRQTLERQLQAIGNHIPNRYLLSFTPSSPVPGFHSLHVEVLGHPEAENISARQGYWFNAQP